MAKKYTVPISENVSIAGIGSTLNIVTANGYIVMELLKVDGDSVTVDVRFETSDVNAARSVAR